MFSAIEELKRSFACDYRGPGADGLKETLTVYNKKFHEKGGMTYYAKFISLVQSSGTGKTRTIIEVFLFLLYC